MTPQVIVTLSPDGRLVAELPGANGSRRAVPLSRDTTSISCEATLLRILETQLTGQQALGLDGAPTGHQVHHWERHGLWKDPSCPFCQGELRRSKRRAKAQHTVGDGSVVVRHTQRGEAQATRMRAEELF